MDALAASGDRVWIDSQPSAGGEWWDRLRDAIAQSDAVIFLATPHSLNNSSVMSEVGAAFAAGKPVIPVIPTNGRLPPGLPGPLRDMAWIRTGHHAINEVAEDVRQRLRHDLADASV